MVEEVNINSDSAPIIDSLSEKNKNMLFNIYIIVLVLLTCFCLLYSGYVYGGRLACKNSNAILIDGFKCEPNKYNPELTPIFNLSPTITSKVT